MKDLIPHHKTRLMVYCALSILSSTTIYGSFFVTSMFQQVQDNKERIRILQNDFLDMSLSRQVYIARFEKVEALQKEDHVTLDRMADRMKDVVHMLLGLKIIKR